MKAEDHAHITGEAIRQFIKYSRSPVTATLLRYSRLVQQGAKDADTSPLYTRATNWHFYNGNLEQDSVKKTLWPFHEPLVIHLSSNHILQRRVAELDQEIAKNNTQDALLLVGRILHHIQDMSTPSHVVPVYHGPLITDSFETYLNSRFLADIDRLNAIALELSTEDVLQNPLANGSSIMDIYEHGAETTLAYLKEKESWFEARVNGEPRKLPWSYFWQAQTTDNEDSCPANSRLPGFGNFGPLGKYFGETADLLIDKTTYQIDRQVYDVLCHNLVKDMLRNSLQVLHCLESTLERLH